jgi:hypothetical protein
MSSRNRLWALLLIVPLLGACQHTEKPAKVYDDPQVDDKGVLQYQFLDPINAVDRIVLIDESGRVRVAQTTGADQVDRQFVESNVTKEQRDDLKKALSKWKQLKPSYPASFGPIFTITFDGYRVEGADNANADPTLRQVKRLVDNIANLALQNAPRATTQAATGPAQAPTTAPAVRYYLKSDLEYQYTFTLMSGPVIHRKITVSQEGGVLQVKEETTGPEPHDPPVEAKIHLTATQMETLANTLRYLPEGDQRYPGLEDGPYFQIKYAGRSIISGGLPDAPSAVKSTQQLLEGYAMDAKRFPEE